MSKKRLAVIPARGNSKRIVNKNIRPFCGSSLTEFALDFCQDSKLFDEIILSSDSQNILDLGMCRAGVNCRKRSDELSSDTALITDVIKDLMRGKSHFETCYLIEPTSVFRKQSECFEMVTWFENSAFNSFGSVSPVKSHPDKMISVDSDSAIVGLDKFGLSSRSQDLGSLYEFNGLIYGFKIMDFMVQNPAHIMFGHSGAFVNDRTIFDINNMQEFQEAEAWHEYEKNIT